MVGDQKQSGYASYVHISSVAVGALNGEIHLIQVFCLVIDCM